MTVRELRGFPPSLPPALQLKLQVIAEGFSATAGLSSPKAADRWKDARKIQKSAANLTRLVQDWHTEFSDVSVDADAREDAERDLLAAGLSADEVATARVGFDPFALRFALLGLQLHMRALAAKHAASGGRPANWRARRLVEMAADEFRMAGLPVKRAGRDGLPSLFSGTCEAMFGIAGIASRGYVLNPDDLIREVVGENPLKS